MTPRRLAHWTALLIGHIGLEAADKAALRRWVQLNMEGDGMGKEEK